MAANELTIEQSSTLLSAVVAQATGSSALAAYNTSDLITVANAVLKQDTEKMLNAMSQVMSRSIYSVRPYNRKFPGLQVTEQRFGNHVRKVNAIDGAIEDDDRQKLADGASIDQYTVSKPAVVQTNFYGQHTYQRHITVFRDQIDVALSGPEEWARFYSMMMTNVSDQLEQVHEATARATLANFIMGKVTADTGSCIHLLTEYNAQLGLTELTTPKAFDINTIYLPDNFAPFMRWAFARIATLCAVLSERTLNWHINITGKELQRHTPAMNQKLYIYAPMQYQMDAMVLANTYHDKYLSMVDHEVVNFWQASGTPDSINVKATYLKAADGTLVTMAAAATQANILGVLFDEEAMGYTVVNRWQAASPFNARGGYHNLFWHFTERNWNDFTENGIIFLLD
jgi:hypothetical protein